MSSMHSRSAPRPTVVSIGERMRIALVIAIVAAIAAEAQKPRPSSENAMHRRSP
jgi:hypothetical protein